ncbi:hypothetical protein AVEN_64994-1 [Araneus ventricosus]|uniref:Endonuclease/exonuclease/phosphatase domain-containing protein n=1 Tax=Araneus ventricosus TaxID=182803 RepID=A0A4Y2LQK7_ARAVE|nr:hypothetical protein AVEN_64994-1 [Araneus ventricosus]
MLGDFNGHSILWGNEDINSRGQQIEQLISDHCLCLMNSDEKTYFHAPTRTFNALDLAICSPALLPLLTFTVGSDFYNSDHFRIFIAHADSVRMAHRPSIYIFQRANWDLFKQLATITDAIIDCADISDAVTQVTETILYAADVAIPKSSSRPRKHSKAWWNDECHEAEKAQNKFWGIFRRRPTTENLVAFKRTKAFERYPFYHPFFPNSFKPSTIVSRHIIC